MSKLKLKKVKENICPSCDRHNLTGLETCLCGEDLTKKRKINLGVKRCYQCKQEVMNFVRTDSKIICGSCYRIRFHIPKEKKTRGSEFLKELKDKLA